jgi:hypothetical protein
MAELLRILDLGAHDGYVTLWLARQLREKNVDVEIDGIELNPDAVAIAQRRFDDEGFQARINHGDALAAAVHFEPGTYDAVVAYELIEHVPTWAPSCPLRADAAPRRPRLHLDAGRHLRRGQQPAPPARATARSTWPTFSAEGAGCRT